MRRRIHSPERQRSRWYALGLTGFWFLILLISFADIPDRIAPFRSGLTEVPLMWAVYGSWGMVVPGLVGAFLVVAYCFLVSAVNAKAMAVSFAAVIVALFIGASLFAGSRGEAVYDDRVVHRPAHRGAGLKTAHFDDLERVEIGCSTWHRLRGSVSYSLVYRMVFRDGFEISLSAGGWRPASVRRLAVVQTVHERALRANVPVRTARYGGDGALMNDPVCMAHVVDRYQDEDQAIVRGLFSNIGWRVSGPLPAEAH